MKKAMFLKLALLLLISFGAALVNGCASGATVQGMTNSDLQPDAKPNKKLQEAIAVQGVSGGTETNPLWTSQISDGDFKEALRLSLKAAGFEADSPESARYVLVATLKKVDQPFLGFNMTVVTTIHYLLSEKRTNRILLNQDVTASHTATVGDAFYGPTRLKLSNEGSARENIGQLLAIIRNIDPDKISVQLK